MDETDARVLNRLQEGLPLESRPYRTIAAELGLTQEDVIRRVKRLKQQGIIRRIGASFDPRGLGYVSTLVAARVPPEQVDAFAAVVNEYAEVTHNYERDHDLNVWFTVIAPSREEIKRIIAEIREQTAIDELHDLPASRVFKIDARFTVRGATA